MHLRENADANFEAFDFIVPEAHAVSSAREGQRCSLNGVIVSATSVYIRRALLFLLVVFRILALGQDVVVIANPSVQISRIRAGEIRDIFNGSVVQFHDGSPAVPGMLKGGAVHEVFLRKHIGQKPEEFRAHWLKIVSEEKQVMPFEFFSESALINFVENTPGAIGYASKVPPSAKVKTLTISP